MTSPPLRIALLGGMAAESAELLGSLAREPIRVTVALTFDGPEALEIVSGADVVVTPRFPATLGEVSARLRLVQATGAGTELLDRSAIPDGVPVANCHGHTRAMAEYALGAMLALQRDLVAADRAMRRGSWAYGASFGAPGGGELGGARLVVIGGGESTRELVRLAGAIGMNVTVVTRNPERKRDADPEAVYAPLTALRDHLPGADYLVASVPLTSETELLLDREALALLPAHAILVNMARSRVVDEAALYEALAGRRLRGAAIDVWLRRPSSISEALAPSEQPFEELDNVLITPHFAGWTAQTQRNRWTEIASNIDRVAQGREPVDIVDYGTRPLRAIQGA